MEKIDKQTIQIVAARALIINSSNKLLVVSWNGKTWHTPGGWVEHLEPLMIACEREVMEEIGITIKSERVVYVCEMINTEKSRFGNYPHKFDVYALCSIVGSEDIRTDWTDHDKGDIKYAKYIDNEEWQSSDKILAPKFLKSKKIEELSNLHGCFESITLIQ